MDGVSIVISLIAVVLSGMAFWRSELRGPRVRLLPVPGSSSVSIQVRPGDEGDWTMVNIYRSVLMVNDGPVPGFVSQVRVVASIPRGLTINNGLRAGVVQAGDVQIGHVPEEFARLNTVIQRDEPLRLVVGWWFDCLTTETESVRQFVRAVKGPLVAEIEYDSLERGLMGERFMKRSIHLHPKLDKKELVSWGDGARSVGLARKGEEPPL